MLPYSFIFSKKQKNERLFIESSNGVRYTKNKFLTYYCKGVFASD